MRDAPPTLDAFPRAVVQTALAALRLDRHNPCDAQFGCLLDGPFKLLEPDQRQVRDRRRQFGTGCDFLDYFEFNFAFPGCGDFSQPDALRVRNLVFLTRFDSQNPCEVVGIFTDHTRASVAHFVYEEAPSCHVQ
jgi:hypothetical protein